MKSSRLQKYLKAKKEKKDNPVLQNESAPQNHGNETGPVKEKPVKPKTKAPKKVATVDTKDSKKGNKPPAKKKDNKK